MTESNVDGTTVDPRPEPQLWQAPTLTLLGDARTMTQSGGFASPDALPGESS